MPTLLSSNCTFLGLKLAQGTQGIRIQMRLKFLYFWTEICIRQKDKPVICSSQESNEDMPGTGGEGVELSGSGRRKRCQLGK